MTTETIKIISTENAPSAIGPYSQATKANGFVFCSGQIALDPTTGTLVGDDVETQAKQVLKNLEVWKTYESEKLDLSICHTVNVFNVFYLPEFIDWTNNFGMKLYLGSKNY